MAPDDRDRTFEKALSRHLRLGGSPPACPDAEVLAAYHDHLLAPEQMLSIEQHIATCPRCAELLAQLAATDDLPVDDSVADTDVHEHAAQNVLTMPAPHGTPELVPALSESTAAQPVSLPSRAARVAQSSWRSKTLRGPNWRFLAPAGLLAAVLLLWVAFHESRPPEFQLARNSQQPSPLPSPKPAAPPPPRMEEKETKNETGNYAVAPVPSAGPRASGDAVDALNGYQDKKSAPSAELDKSAPPRSRSSLSTPSPGIAGTASKNPPAASPVVAVPSIVSPTRARDSREPSSDVSANAKPTSVSESVEVTNKAVSQSQVPGEVQNKDLPAGEISATTSQPQREESAKAKNRVDPVVVQAQQVQPDESSASTTITSRQITALTQLAKSIGPNTVSSPDSSVQWRFSSAGLIEHSTNSGASWTVQPSGVVTDLLAASATSTKVCWIVGRDATILRTTDAGAHWTKLPSPAQSDIIGIFAVNKNQATVTTTTHQTYTTKDAAKTWSQLHTP